MVSPFSQKQQSSNTSCLLYTSTYELGYIRYDDDIDGFKEAAKKGVPKQHPRYHYDVN